LEGHKALNRAHLGFFPNDDVSSDEMHYILRVFDVSLMVWSAAKKYTLVTARLYGDRIENMNITSKEYYHQLAPDLKICRIVNGMWQVAGGHGYIDHELAIEDMMRYHETGFTTWDFADISNSN
jgi:hypothetical protein